MGKSSQGSVPPGGYSVVVVTWECAAHLDRLVEWMNRLATPEPELVVVDNASSDQPEAAAKRWRSELRFVGLAENRGYGAAANVGVEAASGDAIVLLNPDTELLDSNLAALATFALERRGLAGPRLLEADGSVQPSASGPPAGIWPWVGAVVPGGVQPQAMRRRTEPWRLECTVEVAWLSAACLAAPREALLELGPFDPAIDLYGEDMDLGLRAARAGVPSYFCPELCRVMHRGRGSSERRWPDGPAAVMEANRRAVLRRAVGPGRERLAWGARVLNLGLRTAAKRSLGRPASRESAELKAAVRAKPVPLAD